MTLIRLFGSEQSRSALVLVPAAGGGAASFSKWRGSDLKDVTGYAVRLPGRESRLQEAPLRTIGAMADDVARDVLELEQSEVSLLGHCSGAFVAYEAAQRIAGGPRVRVQMLIAAAQIAPGRHAERAQPGAGPLTAEDLVAIGMTDPKVLESPALMDVLRPMLEADFAASAAYRPPSGPPPLRAPIFVLSGTCDRGGREDMSGWQACTTNKTTLVEFSGGHDFPVAEPVPIIDWLATVMAAGPSK